MSSRREFVQGALGVLTAASVNARAQPRLESLAGFAGRLIFPGEPDYDRQRRTASTNTRFDRFPVVIAQCASSDDVRRAIEVAENNDLDLAVRAGGHDVLGASTGDGLVIDLSLMNQVVWRGDRLRVGAGALAGAVNVVAAGRDRLVPLGCNPSVGVSGLTLGGGLGWFIGSHGATCDAVRGATAVTLDGRVLNVSSARDADLDWALRGGGGNFAIVTEWRYETFPAVDLSVGVVVLRATAARAFFDWYRETMAEPPDGLTVEVTAQANVEPVIIASIVHSGAPQQAELVFETLRRAVRPIAEDLRRPAIRNLTAIGPDVGRFFRWRDEPLAEPRSPGSYWQGVSVDALSDAIVERLIDAMTGAPAGWSLGLGHTMHGVLTRQTVDATPFLRSDGRTTIHLAGAWQYASRERALMDWVDGAIAQLRPHRAQAEYINYLSRDDSEAVDAAYGPHLARLRAIKRRYDPTNRLKGNRNIAPDGA